VLQCGEECVNLRMLPLFQLLLSLFIRSSVAACCSVWQCVAVCGSVLQCGEECVNVRCSVWQCVAVW